ncbi:MAG TPA: bifunctional UDP-N-acetylglucosamine diphosphorylase/glucosamine-1-phosphate N-acetyltransferase GlmU, partial [Myxococcaceae bacterium]|nr:bifunctional UDP-N-acetylglucosamine diphosphorylase/glucosamine-1-phosphate N-acetyltransferase GlmU [Myxococcaceae bacterium]
SLAAVVLCAGKGTRMKSDQAKVLHPVLGKPLCAYPIARAFEVGASPVVVVTGHQAAQVEQSVRTLFPREPVAFAVQREQLGTADAVRAAQTSLEGFQGTVLILYGDGPLLSASTLRALQEAHRLAPAPLALVTTVFDDPADYGRVVRSSTGAVERIVEKKDCTPEQLKLRECNMGIYLVDAEFLWQGLSAVKSENAKREFYLTDLVEAAAKKGRVGVVVVDKTETAAVNDRVDLADCTRLMRERINRRHMEAGVTLFDPATTYIEEDVEIGPDTVVEPGVSLLAGTRVGARVRLGQGAVLIRSVIGDGSVVKPYSIFEEALVGRDCHVGPFARLRPGTDLAEEVHIGNFVELKKTHVGRGSKAGHLAYLGDAQVGVDVNVGAGTITCNYDGVHKHQTVIGNGAFIGSDSQLVAPVQVGEGAFVAAGTTVVEDVPPQSLALSRSPQVVKEGWALERRKKSGK